MRPPSTVTASAASASPRPTHFLALRLGNPALRAHVAELQRAVIARSPSLADCAVPPVRSHLTTLVLHAPDEEAVSAAVEALNACRPLATAHFAEAPRVQLRSLAHVRGYAPGLGQHAAARTRGEWRAQARGFGSCPDRRNGGDEGTPAEARRGCA